MNGDLSRTLPRPYLRDSEQPTPPPTNVHLSANRSHHLVLPVAPHQSESLKHTHTHTEEYAIFDTSNPCSDYAAVYRVSVCLLGNIVVLLCLMSMSPLRTSSCIYILVHLKVLNAIVLLSLHNHLRKYEGLIQHAKELTSLT